MRTTDMSMHEQVMEALKKFVPHDGSQIITRVGLKAKVLWRDENDVVHVEDWKESK